MTYVIEHLENHNAVISPKLLRLDKIYRRAVLRASLPTPSTTSTAGNQLSLLPPLFCQFNLY